MAEAARMNTRGGSACVGGHAVRRGGLARPRKFSGERPILRMQMLTIYGIANR